MFSLSPPTYAQEPRELTIRGYRFDPLSLERAGSEGLRTLQIGEDLAAREPGTNVAHWRILQFSRPIDRAMRERLRSTGLGLELYVGSRSYIERVTMEMVEALRADDLLRATIPYHPAFKLSPSIGRAQYQTEQRRAVEGLVLRAIPFEGANLESLAAEIRGAGGTAVSVQDDRDSGGDGQITFRLAGVARLSAVARIDGIRSIEEVGEIVLDNVKAASTGQSGNDASSPIWDENLHGEDQIVSVIDQGPPDWKHCFFKDDNVPDGVPNDDAGPTHRKLVDVRNLLNVEPSSHATFVAGNLVGDDYHDPGMHMQRGGAWGARLHSGSVCDFLPEVCGSMDAAPSTFFDELMAALESGAYIHSNSWHENKDLVPAGYSAWAVAVDKFTRMHEDHLVVGSAGRQGQLWGPPAIAKNTLTVSAAQADPNEMNFGDGFDSMVPTGQQKPDLTAVGCGIFSADLTASSATCGVRLGGSPLKPCSTSYATPHVAALAALVRQYYLGAEYPPETWQGTGTLQPTGALLKATLINSARDMTGVPGFPTLKEGWGVVTLDETVVFAGSDRQLRVWDVRSSDTEALETGDAPNEYSIYVADGTQPLKVTLVWTDYEDGSGDGELVNNLDLEVERVTPAGTTKYLGNHFNGTTGLSVVGGSADVTNNVEQIILPPPASGEWTLRVKAGGDIHVEGDVLGQGYALVVSGKLGSEERVQPQPPEGLIVR